MSDRHARTPRNQNGSTLLLTLVMIIVVSVAGAAVLSQLNVAPRAQDAYTNTRTVTLDSDGVLDSLIQGLRKDKNAGYISRDGSVTGACTNTDGSDVPLGVSTGAYKQYDVVCAPVNPVTPGLTPQVPDSTVVAFGGMAGLGNYGNIPFSQSSNIPWRPFCDDYHDFKMSTGDARCEASIFVGNEYKTTADGNSGGGLYIASNGSLSGAAVVRANGSIVASNYNGLTRQLNVAGGIEARRFCGWGNTWTASSFWQNINAWSNPLGGSCRGIPKSLRAGPISWEDRQVHPTRCSTSSLRPSLRVASSRARRRELSDRLARLFTTRRAGSPTARQ